MELRTSFDRLSEVIDSFETAWGEVLHVETRTGSDSTTLQGSLELPLRYCGASDDGDGRVLRPADVEFRDDGGLSLSFAAEDFGARDPSTPAGVTTRWEDVRIDEEAGIVVSVRFAIRPPEEAADPSTGPVENAAPAAESVAAAEDRVEGPEPETGDGSPRDPTVDRSPGGETRDGSPGDSRRDACPGDSMGDAGSQEQSGPDAATESFAEIRDEDVPPFEDRPYLQELYESCENFGEMSEIIEMDVSAETVRRYMIEAGVHTPDSYDTREDEQPDGAENRSVDAATMGEAEVATDGEDEAATDGEDEAATDGEDEAATDGEDEAATDGEEEEVAPVPEVDLDPDRFGLPRDMTIEETIDAVVDSRSLHEVTRHLDIDHDQARDLLRELDLLDFVSHRLVDAPEAEPTYEEVASRIRRSSPQTV